MAKAKGKKETGKSVLNNKERKPVAKVQKKDVGEKTLKAVEVKKRKRRFGPEEDVAKKLWADYKKDPSEDARNAIVEAYLPLVRYTAERMSVRLPDNVDVDDLISAGVFGLMDAVTKFDTDKGVMFETYSSRRIHGAILDDIRSKDWVPRLVRSRASLMDRAVTALMGDDGKMPSDEALAKHMDLNSKTFDDWKKETQVRTQVSLDGNWAGDSNERESSRIEMHEDKNSLNPTKRLENAEFFEGISRGLIENERLILTMYYYDELTMREIGDILGLSESRVCQIHAQVIRRLRDKFGSDASANMLG